MKRLVQVLALGALLAATAQAALPKNQMKLGFGGGNVPVCPPGPDGNPDCRSIN